MPLYEVGLNFMDMQIEASDPDEAKETLYRSINISRDFYANEVQESATDNAQQPLIEICQCGANMYRNGDKLICTQWPWCSGKKQ